MIVTFVLASIALAQEAYVLGDLVHLRDQPSLDAEVRTRLRINTPLDVQQSQGAWLRVAVQGRPPESPVEGWLASHLVSNNPLTRQDARRHAETAWQAGRRAEAIRWAERAYAMDISHHGAQARLQHMKNRRIPSRTSFDIALCNGTRASLIARYDVSDGWVPHTHQLRYWSGAGSIPWFVAGHQGSGPVPGATFVRPFATSRHDNATAHLAYAPSSEPTCDDDCIIRLGACDDKTAVYSSLRLHPLSGPPPLPRQGPAHLLLQPPTSGVPFPSSQTPKVDIPDASSVIDELAPRGAQNPRWFTLTMGAQNYTLAVLDVVHNRQRGTFLVMIPVTGDPQTFQAFYDRQP